MVKLDAMENPYPLPPTLRRRARRAPRRPCALNRYPEPTAATPAAQLCAQRMRRPGRAWSVMLGNGSDELIQIIALALACAGARR